MKRLSLLSIAIIYGFLSGCASVPMASLEMDAEAKQFLVPPGKSSIYLYRNETMGGAITMPVALDGRVAGKSGPKTYFKWDVTPGEHEITSLTENTSKITIDAIAGKIHYIWQEVKMGVWSARSLLQEVTEEQGKAGVGECKLAVSEI